MTDKEGGTKRRVVREPRRYDLVDMFIIGFYNLVIFSIGLGAGWFIWGGKIMELYNDP